MEGKLLEEFRKEWKAEINLDSKPQPSQHQVLADAGENGLLQNNKSIKVDSNPKSIDILSFDTPEVEKKKKKMFQPFVIAEDLLSGNSASSTLTPDPASMKRKSELREELFKQKNKRLKLLSPESSVKSKRDDSLLDILIADLDEITEIPFFDIAIPRELAINVFKNLTAIDLCRCSQVSKAWKHIADDELLWSTICHSLGYEENMVTNDKAEWKDIVKDHVVQERKLQQNWKMRTGKTIPLDYAKGGVLCSAHSHRNTIAAGYSNGDINVWDVLEEDSYTLRPSNTALVLDEANDSGTITNHANNIVINEKYTIASYCQGNIDMWKNHGSLDPIHSVRCSEEVKILRLAGDSSIFSGLHGKIITTEAMKRNSDEFHHAEVLEMEERVSDIHLVPKSTNHQSSTSIDDWNLVISQYDQVKIHRPGNDPSEMRSLHHVALQAVSAVDCSHQHVAVGVRADAIYQGTSSSIRVYDLCKCSEISSHDSHNGPPSVIAINNCPPQSFVSGGWNRKVTVYDTRIYEPVSTFIGHNGQINCVKMDEWKVISGSSEGLVCVWDQRMASKLWDIHNRHSVKYLNFTDKVLITANIPAVASLASDEYDSMVHRRHRGALHVYDFSVDQIREGLPEVCQSTYDQPEGYSYNINLMTPYDIL